MIKFDILPKTKDVASDFDEVRRNPISPLALELHQIGHDTMALYDAAEKRLAGTEDAGKLLPHMVIGNLLNTVHMLRTTYPSGPQYKYFVQYILDEITKQPFYKCYATPGMFGADAGLEPVNPAPSFEDDMHKLYNPFSFPEFMDQAPDDFPRGVKVVQLKDLLGAFENAGSGKPSDAAAAVLLQAIMSGLEQAKKRLDAKANETANKGQ